MLETFITWFLIGSIIKIIYELHSKPQRRRRAKDQATDLFAIVAVIVLLALVVS